MRPAILTVSLLIASYAAGQDYRGEDAAYVRMILREAKSKSVTQVKTGMPAREGALKVYIFAPGQERMAAELAARLDEWNGAEGGRYGRLDVVTDAAGADIILARFVGPLKSDPDPAEETTSTGNGVLLDPVTHRPLPVARAPGHVHHTAKVFCYVAAREGDGLKLLWRERDAVRVNEKHADRYWELKGSKDSKTAGDRLRRRFLEMMRARTQPARPDR